MNVLIVHAQAEPRSFCSYLRRSAELVLASQGHRVVVSDLHAQGFNPIASVGDFLSPRDPDHLVYAQEQRYAAYMGTLAPDIQAEIDKVMAADLLIFTFQLSWCSVPAILKGWFERVFVAGPFYGGRRVFAHGGMKGKKALLACTVGLPDYLFGANGLHGDLLGLLRPVTHGTLGYAGFEVLTPFAAHLVADAPAAQREVQAHAWLDRLRHIDQEPTLPMPDIAQFDDTLAPRTSCSTACFAQTD